MFERRVGREDFFHRHVVPPAIAEIVFINEFAFRTRCEVRHSVIFFTGSVVIEFIEIWAGFAKCAAVEPATVSDEFV